MRIISAGDIDTSLTDRGAIEVLRQSYRTGVQVPSPVQLDIPRPKDLSGHFLIQPTWSDFAAQGHTDLGYVGTSLSLTLPEGQEQSSQLYLLFSGKGGQPIALVDGARLGVWRDAGLHALAAEYLAREDAQRLLVIGSDPRLPRLLAAYASVRNISYVLFAGTDRDVRRRIASIPELSGITSRTTDDIAAALEGADIVCLAGKDTETGSWADLSRFDPPTGCHVDVLGEAPPLPDSIWQDARLFTTNLPAYTQDNREWAADINDLAKGQKAGRRYYGQRTLFISSPDTGPLDFALATHVFLKT